MKRVSIIALVLLFSFSLFSSEFEKKYNLKSQIDEKNGIIWYKHKKNTGTSSRVYVYFGKKQDANQYFIRMVLAYYGSSRLIINEFKFTIDGEEHVVTPRAALRTIDVNMNRARIDQPSDEGSGICEFYDIAINQEELELMEKLSNAKTVKLRYTGLKGFKKTKIHNSSKKAIRDVLAAFKDMVGSPDKQGE